MATTPMATGVTITHPESVRVEVLTPDVPGVAVRRMRASPGVSPALPSGLADAGLTVAADGILVPPRGAQRSMRATPGDIPRVEVDIAPGEGAVVLVEANGVFTWVTPDEVPGPPGARRAQRQLSFTLVRPPAVAPPGAAPPRRNVFTDWLVDAVLDQVRVVVFKYVGRWAAATLAARLEGALQPGPVAMPSLDIETWRPLTIQATTAGPAQKILLFVHGTFSSTRGSFGHLVSHPKGRAFLSGALKAYHLILGFDHRTLTEDPMTNAQQILTALGGLALPEGSKIDAIAYSRGGLVLRSLMEGLLGGADAVLPGVVFNRAVFVGCTNGGTHLAEPENVKDLLDTYTNLFARGSTMLGSFGGPTGIAIGKAFSTSVSLLGRFAQALADAAIEDNVVPGLAAMRPDGNVVTQLNQAQNPGSPNTTYFAVSANFEPAFEIGAGIAKETAELLIDRIADRLFKDQANDLVVDTAAMTALGTLSARLASEHEFPFGETDRVYHITYFAQPEVADKLSGWLGLPAPAELLAPPIPASAPSVVLEAAPVVPPVTPTAPVGRPLRRGALPTGRVLMSDELRGIKLDKLLPDSENQPATGRVRTDSECHFAARMPPNPPLGKRTRLEVIVSRAAIDLAVSATSAKSGPVAVSLAQPLTIEVIGLKNARVVDPVPAEVVTEAPADDNPVTFVFRVDGVAFGAAEFLVEIRQSARVLTSFTLRPIFIDDESEMLTVTASATVNPAAQRNAVLRIYEIQPVPGRISLRFDLECADPNININQTISLRDGFNRESYVTELLKNVETAWFSDSISRERFMTRLRAIGEDMANELLPERLRRALWTNRKRIAGIQVLSEDTSFPWEMMFLADPDRQDVDGEGFLAEYGLIRWLHDTQWPPRRLSVRPNHVRYVVPNYPVPDYELPEAQQEREVLKTMFPGAVQLEADSVVLNAQLRRPGPIDILHVSGHGTSTVGGVIRASLLMTGRLGQDGRYETDELTDSIVKTALAFDANSQPIVFLNACQAGRSGNSMVGVGGFAAAFLKPVSTRGAGAFIGAQWSVGDSTALIFAKKFYESLLGGQTLVEATRAARNASKDAGELSWLSYTVYGDPAATAVRP
ncbi:MULTISPECIES: CHAT domain-containing protein [unclassified Bradyrhizobium]|uniref:DUF7379 domain-containing protein n=1 Tax=unclassified Bradyrhizobium TaxID=2631580 RepID=UPI0024787E02|nr:MULTISPECIES: CHAT domain-containing protein [unclassified Bradyrhizobium]WGR67976.1 CHAT domain-containing protein [Bradyrhizobium sp. ISRA426]WGR80030.1 CHAT domain-containing protein [Bradyrhizobium sp. ISRA430]WGR83215.1 CHAT domain-containing protein [Bradyrhizobium sp. ISRA432]